jgi:hypothetical protein
MVKAARYMFDGEGRKIIEAHGLLEDLKSSGDHGLRSDNGRRDGYES